MIKNAFCFATLVATASLGLGLMVCGCGDGGSTTPNPLEGDTSSKVVFNYSVLAQKLSAKTEISANIASVKYSFKGVDENQKAFTDSSDKYVYKFTHKNQAYDQKVIIKDVSMYTTEVTAAYYNENNELVAIGVDQLDWDKTTKVAKVETPKVQLLDQDATASLSVDNYVIPKSGQVKLTFEITPTEGAKAVDMTDLATFSGLDEKVFAHSEDEPVGFYTGISYGKSDTVSASIGAQKAELDKVIYVTDQTPSKIEISFLPIDGKEVSVFKDNEGIKGVFIFYAADPEQVFGLKIASNDVAYIKEQKYNYAINELPLAILATEFTNADDKGPQPDYAVDITDSDKLSVTTENTSGEENYLAVKDHFTLQATGLNSDNERSMYNVKAKYDDGTSEGLTDQIVVRLKKTYGRLAFVEKEAWGRELTTDDIYAGNIWVKEGQTFEHSLVLKGVVFLYNGYTVLDIPESMIPADQYPNLKEPRYSFPEQATKSVYEVVTTYEHIGSGNDYKITTTGLPEVQLIMDIDRPEDASYPELWTPIVQHFEWDS
mgnify:CR=1 FL=1